VAHRGGGLEFLADGGLLLLLGRVVQAPGAEPHTFARRVVAAEPLALHLEVVVLFEHALRAVRDRLACAPRPVRIFLPLSSPRGVPSPSERPPRYGIGSGERNGLACRAERRVGVESRSVKSERKAGVQSRSAKRLTVDVELPGVGRVVHLLAHRARLGHRRLLEPGVRFRVRSELKVWGSGHGAGCSCRDHSKGSGTLALSVLQTGDKSPIMTKRGDGRERGGARGGLGDADVLQRVLAVVDVDSRGLAALAGQHPLVRERENDLPPKEGGTRGSEALSRAQSTTHNARWHHGSPSIACRVPVCTRRVAAGSGPSRPC